jgi:hypothetical protein
MAATTSVVRYDPQDTYPEVRTLAGFSPGTPAAPARRTRSTCACSTGGATSVAWGCST